MAGLSSRFFKYGFKKIKYELPMTNGKRMIDMAIETLGVPTNSKFFFVIREDVQGLPGDVTKIDYVTDGPACTCNLVYEKLNPEEPLIIANCDQVLDYNYNKFIETCEKYDGCVMTYSLGDSQTPIGSIDKHSYFKEDPPQFTEKIVISDNPLTGIHYFKKAKYFKEGYDYMIYKNMRAPNGEFYISLVYQALIQIGCKIGQYKLGSTEYFYPVGEPQDYFDYIGQIRKFKVYDGYKFGDSPVIYSNGSIYVEGQCINDIDLTNYTRGWIIGDFEPCLFKRTDYEVGILTHVKNVHHDFHVHNKCTEYNLLLEGLIELNGQFIYPGDVFIIPKGYISCALIRETSRVLCVKTPSIPSDKILY